MRYDYRNRVGQVFTVDGSMQNPPPSEIVIFKSGDWVTPGGRIRDREQVAELLETPPFRRVCHRVYGSVQAHIPDLAGRSKDGRVPVSQAAPRIMGGKLDKIGDQVVRIHADGIMTNSVGQPIIDSNAATRRVAKATGMEID